MLRTRLGRIGIAGVAVLTVGLPATTASAVDEDIDYTTGEVTLVAGDPVTSDLGDGGPALEAFIQGPTGLARDAEGNLYIASDAGLVRKVAADGTISTFAGGGEPEGNGDGGPAVDADLIRPFDVVFDDAGNAYISDNADGRVRKVATDGTISTFAGGSDGEEGSGDGGPAVDAYLGTPSGLAWHAGELYIAGGFTGVVRKVAKDGTISTIAGSTGPDEGVLAVAPLEQALGIVLGVDVDADGNVYITSTTFGPGGKVWKLDTNDDLTVVAGRDVSEEDDFPDAYGDGGQATDAVLDAALDVAVHPSGGFVITSGESVRAVDASGVISTVAGVVTDEPLVLMLQGTELPLSSAIGVHIDADDTLLFTDADDGLIWRLIMNDVTDPVVKITVPDSISRYDNPSVSIDCSDNRPGVECTGTADGATLDTSLQRPDPITVTGTDAAGNTTTETVSYSVEWEVTGTHAASSGTEATIARLYAAYFGRLPEDGGFDYWEGQLTENPEALTAASNFFSASTEFQTLYGSITNEEFVTLIYRNVMGRTPETEGYDFWVLQLEQESFTRGEVMLFFSQSIEFKALTKTS